MKKAIVGIIAHVDAGKTTLAEALLYQAGALRRAGRVDHGDTVMDTHAIERARGITVFAGEALLSWKDSEITLLDTPGHVDFSAETERMLRVMDYAILVISGTDGVQAHTHTLWKLLDLYQVPTFVFVTKMDYARRTREALMEDLRRELSEGFVDFTASEDERQESLALCCEDLLESYLAGKKIEDEVIADRISERQIFPCYFGSGLRMEGIEAFFDGLDRYLPSFSYPDLFGAKIYKISYDAQGNRLTHLKVTGGRLRVRDTVADSEEKITQIRLYQGMRYQTVDELSAGSVGAVLGLSRTRAGQGLGHEVDDASPQLEPVMQYRIRLPQDCDPKVLYPKLQRLEEEDPQLRLNWDPVLQEIQVSLMGAIQKEVLKSLIRERFDIEAEFDSGHVLYKETIAAPVEGVGHYEPLRHYAEVHLLLEPLPRGTGVIVQTSCREDELDRNWQRLILTHITERRHLGVLTGSPLTDVKITLVAGRAHLKHTEGGDFRQATYRAVRQGLMQAESVLLEPYYAFSLAVPSEFISRAIYDLRMRAGTLEGEPHTDGGYSVLRGMAPVTTWNEYAMEVAAYTGGRGHLSCALAGYGPCHNADEVIRQRAYDPEADLENTPDSVFCAHGAGFAVKWNQVSDYMHLAMLRSDGGPNARPTERRDTRIEDKELEAIMEREFGPIKRPVYREAVTYRAPEAEEPVHLQPRARYILVDGYNVIFAWKELSELAKTDFGAARQQLLDILSHYQAYTRCEMIVVFDGYKVAGGQGERTDYQGVHVVYTKEHETGDMYIEKLVAQIGRNTQVRVVTSDGLIQLSAVRSGVMRMSALEFEQEIEMTKKEIRAKLEQHNDGASLGHTVLS